MRLALILFLILISDKCLAENTNFPPPPERNAQSDTALVSTMDMVTNVAAECTLFAEVISIDDGFEAQVDAFKNSIPNYFAISKRDNKIVEKDIYFLNMYTSLTLKPVISTINCTIDSKYKQSFKIPEGTFKGMIDTKRLDDTKHKVYIESRGFKKYDIIPGDLIYVKTLAYPKDKKFIFQGMNLQEKPKDSQIINKARKFLE